MPHTNSLPDDKVDYVRSMLAQKSLRLGLGISLPKLAVLMYHCEVPYNQAVGYLDCLGRTIFRTPAMPEHMPDQQLQRMFDACGAGAEAPRFIATLNTKRTAVS